MGCSCSKPQTPSTHESTKRVENVRNAASDTWEVGSEDALTILMVDDDPVNLRVLQRHVDLAIQALVKRGLAPPLVETMQASSTAEARLVFDAQPHDRRIIVFLDTMMPEENGYVLARQHQGNAHVAFVACTGNIAEHHISIYRDAGYSGVVHKPIKPAMIKTAIHRFMLKPWRWWSSTNSI